MLAINEKLISEDILEEHFVCDLKKCKGACCVEGDTGAPLELDELKILDEIYETVKPYLTPQGLAVLERQKYMWEEEDKKWKTPLIENGPCAYIVYENGIAICGIERAFLDKKIAFQKPISCHLYPIRITKKTEFEALNYERWNICNCAIKLGKQLKVPVFRFVKDALIRKYGEEFYDILENCYTQKK